MAEHSTTPRTARITPAEIVRWPSSRQSGWARSLGKPSCNPAEVDRAARPERGSLRDSARVGPTEVKSTDKEASTTRAQGWHKGQLGPTTGKFYARTSGNYITLKQLILTATVAAVRARRARKSERSKRDPLIRTFQMRSKEKRCSQLPSPLAG